MKLYQYAIVECTLEDGQIVNMEVLYFDPGELIPGKNTAAVERYALVDHAPMLNDKDLDRIKVVVRPFGSS